MCKWGTDTKVLVKIAAELSHTGAERWDEKGIDSCIAPIVKALQEGGVDMLGSCCGHGKDDGNITLADGRTLVIKQRVSARPVRVEAIDEHGHQDIW